MKKKEFNQLNKIQRTQLEVGLKYHKSLSSLAKEIGVSRQTLYREILRNSYTTIHDSTGLKQSCINFKQCRKEIKGLQFSCPNKCIKYSPGRQDCLNKYPFVCNYCSKKRYCKFLHYYYDSEKASFDYHSRIEEANSKPKTETSIINLVNKIVYSLIKKGQSVEAILMNHPEIPVSSLTIRNWIKEGLLDCKLSELRMNGRRIPSKQYNYNKGKEYKSLSSKKIGHKYTNYLLYVKEHPSSLIVQLDSVIGCIDGKLTVLTIHIVNYKFQFGILLEHHTKEEVFNKLNSLFSKMKGLEDTYGYGMYSAFTEVLLTDNGPEFDALLDFNNIDPNIHIFYCHPLSSFEKGSCERNHVLVRYIQYKGWSFDNFTQEDINCLFSNINSYPRKSLNEKTPYQVVFDDPRLGKEFLDLIGVYKVDCDDVTLNPSLLRKIKK